LRMCAITENIIAMSITLWGAADVLMLQEDNKIPPSQRGERGGCFLII
jgi:hypothetical protein